jgi:XTP/dITP diphosphohydrolase
MSQIVFASNNNGKLREARQFLEPLGFTVLSPSEAGAVLDVDETGSSFEENAYLKAYAVYERVKAAFEKLPVIADDSGIEVDYLDGAPGIYSARYASEDECCEKLLSELSGVPAQKRGARFVCALCFMGADGSPLYVRGVAEGVIAFEERGRGGFGYDPVFLYGDKTFAEMSPEEKNAVSHRADAFRKLAAILNGNGGGGVSPRYDLEMQAVMRGLELRGETPRLLLHACCAPCSSYALECLTERFAVTLFYYNPNIRPEGEYEKRLYWLKELLRAASYKNAVE